MRQSIRCPRSTFVARGLAALLVFLLALAVPTGGSATARGAVRLTPRASTTWPAETGTVVYIHATNVWIARPNGNGARQLTHDGTASSPYSSPTEDDAGHVVAVRGKRLVRMDQSGRVLQSFVPPVSSLSIGWAAVSPDGRTIAYGALFGHTDCSFSPCHTLFEHQLHYTAATSPTKKYGEVDGASHATWMTSSRTIVESSTPNQVLIDNVGTTHAAVWFTDCASETTGCNDTNVDHYAPTVTRAGDRYAAAREIDPWSGDATQDLLLMPSDAATGYPPAAPSGGCFIAGPTLKTRYPSPSQMAVYSPSWSPDGRSIVVGMKDPSAGWRVYRFDVPKLGDCATITGGVLLTGASQPSWSRAGLTAPVTTLEYVGTRPAITGTHRVGVRLGLSRTGAQLRQGFAPDATSLSYRWRRDGHAITGATNATYRVVRADRNHVITCRVTGHRTGSHNGYVTTTGVRIR